MFAKKEAALSICQKTEKFELTSIEISTYFLKYFIEISFGNFEFSCGAAPTDPTVTVCIQLFIKNSEDILRQKY